MTVEKYIPHKKQAEVHKGLYENPAMFNIVVSGRQSGKTKLAEFQAALWATSNKNSIVWWVSPTQDQALKVWRTLQIRLQNENKYKSGSKKSGDAYIELKNGSRIEFKSASSEDSLRGNSVNYLIIDEAAFIKEDVITKILLPTLNVAGKQVLIISTPRGKNWLYNWFLLGLDENEKNYKSFKFTSEDNPLSNKLLIEAARKQLTAEQFNQEFMAEFVDGAAIFKNIVYLPNPETDDVFFIGVDIGMVNDFTVVTVFNTKGQMVHIERWKGIQTSEIKKNIDSTISRFPGYCLIESNNQGLPIIQDLRDVWGNYDIMDFNTSTNSKEIIINAMQADISERRVTFLPVDYLKEELDMYSFDYTKTGKIKFGAPSGYHDDAVMSSAIGLECWRRCRNNSSGKNAITANNIVWVQL